MKAASNMMFYNVWKTWRDSGARHFLEVFEIKKISFFRRNSFSELKLEAYTTMKFNFFFSWNYSWITILKYFVGISFVSMLVPEHSVRYWNEAILARDFQGSRDTTLIWKEACLGSFFPILTGKWRSKFQEIYAGQNGELTQKFMKAVRREAVTFGASNSSRTPSAFRCSHFCLT